MSQPNFTPGPLAMSRDAVPEGHVQITVYSETTGQRVATVFETEDNARLFVAAPALYEACKKALTCASLNSDVRTLIGAALALVEKP